MRRPLPIDWNAQPLGKSSDRALAQALHVTHPTVRRHRKLRGIPAYGVESLVIDWGAQPLGEIPDAELSRRLGVSKFTVMRQRNKRGIPKSKKSASWLSAKEMQLLQTILNNMLRGNSSLDMVKRTDFRSLCTAVISKTRQVHHGYPKL